MIKISRNNLKYQNVRSPPPPPPHTAQNTLPMFATGYYCIRTCHSKQFSVGLMVLSDGLVYFLKIDKKKILESTKTILSHECWFRRIHFSRRLPKHEFQNFCIVFSFQFLHPIPQINMQHVHSYAKMHMKTKWIRILIWILVSPDGDEMSQGFMFTLMSNLRR